MCDVISGGCKTLIADDAVDGADRRDVRLAADVFLQQPATT